MVLGGVQGLEHSLAYDHTLHMKDVSLLFHHYLNVCPNQGSRTIRTEVRGRGEGAWGRTIRTEGRGGEGAGGRTIRTEMRGEGVRTLRTEVRVGGAGGRTIRTMGRGKEDEGEGSVMEREGRQRGGEGRVGEGERGEGRETEGRGGMERKGTEPR